MPQIDSAKKRLRQRTARTVRNHARLSRIRTFVRHVYTAVEEKSLENAQACLTRAIAELHRAASRGVIHANLASRKSQRLNRLVKKLATSS